MRSNEDPVQPKIKLKKKKKRDSELLDEFGVNIQNFRWNISVVPFFSLLPPNSYLQPSVVFYPFHFILLWFSLCSFIYIDTKIS